MTPEQAAALRAPFPPEVIGKLPRPTKRDNPKGQCAECGGYHGLPAVHLDYVGHAAVTDRLLQVDPEWTWEPLAVDEHGLPLSQAGGLWIKLTICGVTRLGYGDQENGKGVKEVIGDAIRNAAMRFGVALDLWSKQDLRPVEESDENGHAEPKPKPEPPKQSAKPKKAISTWPELLAAYDERHYRHPWQEWWAEIVAAFFNLRIETDIPFGEVVKILSAEQKDRLWQGCLRVLDSIEHSQGDLGPTRADVRKAFAEEFEGAVVFGPKVKMAPDEEYPAYNPEGGSE